MNKDNLIKEFIDAFPELKAASLKELEEEGRDILIYVFFGNVLTPFLEENFPVIKNEELIKRFFTFLELMANSEDRYVRDVLRCQILEQLGDDPERLEVARSYMGKKTRRLSDRAEWALGRTK